jgi:hypothetical protein
MKALNDEEKSESTMSDLDDMWYTGDKESNIQDFEDEDLVDKEDFKEEMNAYIVEGLRVPHDELKKLQAHRVWYLSVAISSYMSGL